MLVIRPENNRGVIHGDVPTELEDHLQSQFVWYDVLDLTNPIYFYADKAMYLGVMRQVCDAIKAAGYECEIEFPPLGDKPFWEWEFVKDYRPRQEDAVNALIEGRIGQLKAAPGFGKTVCMAAITATLGRRTAVIVQAGEPFDQAYNTLRGMTNIRNIGRVSGDVRDLQEVTVYMIQTLWREIVGNPDGEVAKWFADAEVVMVDECHHSAADTYLLALNAVKNPYYVLGFSATPELREDGLQPFVTAYMGKPLFEVTYGDQIADGSLCPLTIYVANMTRRDYGYSKAYNKVPTYQRMRQYRYVYDTYVVRNEERNREAIQFAQEMMEDGLSVAIIVSRKDHAKLINKMFPEAVVLISTTARRRQILSDLRQKKIMCVVTTLFDEATDVPSLGAVCLLAGGKTEIRLRQRLRSTRVFSGETAQGYYHKTRGYVWYPFDQADFLRSHSRKCLQILQSIVLEHPENELIRF